MTLHDECSAVEAFLAIEATPTTTADASAASRQLELFLDQLSSAASTPWRLIVITSGGTAVPLERNPVRFVSNFSTGGRGAKLTEAFLHAPDTAVVLLHSKSAKLPFRRALDDATPEALLAAAMPLEHGNASAAVLDESKRIVASLADFSRFTTGQTLSDECTAGARRLLLLPFDTITDYFTKLKAVCQTVSMHPHYGIAAASPWVLVLAAAVSDYYLPLESMHVHKLSGPEPLQLTLQPVPKALGVIRVCWCRGTSATAEHGAPPPHVIIVSFKLETDASVLEHKAVSNLHKYSCDVVVANLLSTYQREVWIYRRDGDTTKPAAHLVDGGLNGSSLDEQLASALLHL